MKTQKTILFILGLGAAFISSQCYSQEASRGEMLYKNHCLECHESAIHIREQRIVRSKENLDKQVIRWVKELKLAWGHEEIADISRYLNQTIYKFGSDDREQ